MTPTIRRATPGDMARVAEFLEGLSIDTMFGRFLTGLGHPSASMVRHLMRRDHDHGAHIAEADGKVVGHATWCRNEDGSAELAVVVADGWQHRGLGGRLGSAALSEAQAHGAQRARLSVHRGNDPVIGIVHHVWPLVGAYDEDGMLVYDVPLAA
jgi:acetyltransferase